MKSPFVAVEPLSEQAFAHVRRRAIFDCFKWDPQVEDVCTIARHALVLKRGEWEEISRLAAALARETLAAESALLARPDLHGRLGLPRRVRRALARAADSAATPGAARLMRFDFHATPDGWRISEVNSDVPGGLNEAAGFPVLVAPHHLDAVPVGDPVDAYARALAESSPREEEIALVHATAYTDDRQVMACLAARLERMGARPVLASPAHLVWREGRASLALPPARETIGAIARFFPAEWLPELPTACGWTSFFSGARTPVSNPASALLTQTKRFSLAWDELRIALPAWRALLPETRDPRDAAWRDNDEWVLKPALGRVGEGVAIPGLLTAKERAELERSVRRNPGEWAAQRRFEATPLDVGGARVWPCVGVFTVGERVAGAYGRVASRPRIDWRAQDAAVLVERPLPVLAAASGGVR